MRTGLVLVLVAALAVGCAVRAPLEQRTTQGPTAEEFWLLRVAADAGRSPGTATVGDDGRLRIDVPLSDGTEPATVRIAIRAKRARGSSSGY